MESGVNTFDQSSILLKEIPYEIGLIRDLILVKRTHKLPTSNCEKFCLKCDILFSTKIITKLLPIPNMLIENQYSKW